MLISPQDVVLFQGDSITDAGRVREDPQPNDRDALGHGYPRLAAARLLCDQPGVTVHNRGISGNLVTDLALRWDDDAFALQPTVISILIGVNDTWHGVAKHTPEQGTTLPEFDRVYRNLLQETRDRLPKAKLVIGEPFVLECGAVLEMNFHPDIEARIELVHAIAKDYADVFVPFQSVFNDAIQRAEPAYWAFDGVHPTLAGHQLMADAWLEAVTA